MSHPRCDGCRAVALMFDRLFRVEDAKVEHLGLELTLAEVRDIVDTVCRKDVFRYEQLLLRDWLALCYCQEGEAGAEGRTSEDIFS